jgi:myo-inositol-1(or 4)-monophosphatase
LAFGVRRLAFWVLRFDHSCGSFVIREMNSFLNVATRAAREAGDLLRSNFGQPLKVDAEEAHDIKLELDVRSQNLITKVLLAEFPDHGVLGEEGSEQSSSKEFEWVVDPIDGTVNFFYAIPHFCISIALRRKDEILVGVIYDPIREELWQAVREGNATLNNQVIQVSQHTQVSEAIVSVGFSKTSRGIERGMTVLNSMVGRARKCRMMGSAALDLAYVATGRFDAYIEGSVNWWDIAAGVLLVERAGGKVSIKPSTLTKGKLSVVASNGKMNLELPEVS